MGIFGNNGEKTQTQIQTQTQEIGDKQFKQNCEQRKKELTVDLNSRVETYKPMWNKNGVIQFKNERIAIIQRTWGLQVQFIIAYDDLTREGYELKAIDEGKAGGDSAGGFTGGVNAYFYFQKPQK